MTWTLRQYAMYYLRRLGWEVGSLLDQCGAFRVGMWLQHLCYMDVERAWWRTQTGRMMRILKVSRYPWPTYDERMYVCLIAADDPRPRGERWTLDSITRYIETMPVGRWVEITFSPDDVASSSARRRYVARGPLALLPQYAEVTP